MLAVGSSQRLWYAVGIGGRRIHGDKGRFTGKMPGRIIGVSKDVTGSFSLSPVVAPDERTAYPPRKGDEQYFARQRRCSWR